MKTVTNGDSGTARPSRWRARVDPPAAGLRRSADCGGQGHGAQVVGQTVDGWAAAIDGLQQLAGFIGCNLALRLVGLGHEIVVLDNLTRRGSERNLQPLAESDGHRPVVFRRMDVRDQAGLAAVLSDADCPFDAVVHLAGQTTVTESIIDPVEDFDVNARGTLNVLEAVRACAPTAQVVFASTNKVYGDLRTLRAERTGSRYVLPDYPYGIPETFPTNAASPYGCSKLTADSYVRDYAKTYGIATTDRRCSARR